MCEDRLYSLHTARNLSRVRQKPATQLHPLSAFDISCTYLFTFAIFGNVATFQHPHRPKTTAGLLRRRGVVMAKPFPRKGGQGVHKLIRCPRSQKRNNVNGYSLVKAAIQGGQKTSLDRIIKIVSKPAIATDEPHIMSCIEHLIATYNILALPFRQV